jgi:phosphoribosyl 1,2-cyclic phosphodiesterase
MGGLLFFPAFFDPQKRFDFHGSGDIKSVVNSFLSPPLHPVGLEVFNADLRFNSINAGDKISVSDEVTVKTCSLSHPGGAIAYRVEFGGKVFCCCIDSELAHHQNDEPLLEFTQGADLLVLDSFFDDGKVIEGWGHSSWRECAEWAKRVGAKRLALFHHNFRWSDEQIDEMSAKSQEVFGGAFAAADFMRVEI